MNFFEFSFLIYLMHFSFLSHFLINRESWQWCTFYLLMTLFFRGNKSLFHFFCLNILLRFWWWSRGVKIGFHCPFWNFWKILFSSPSIAIVVEILDSCPSDQMIQTLSLDVDYCTPCSVDNWVCKKTFGL